MNCPRCGDAWGIEEMSFNECDSCNYPHDDPNDSGDDDDFEGDDDGWENDSLTEAMELDKQAESENNKL